MNKTTKTLALLALAASLGVGCSENDNHHNRSGDKDRDGIPDRSDPHPNRADLPAGDARYDRAGDLRGIPRDAVRLEKDEGPEMRVRPNQDGRIYVYDPRADRIVYEGRLRAKEEFIAIPDRDSITIDGKRVDSARLNSRDRYQLYFLRD